MQSDDMHTEEQDNLLPFDTGLRLTDLPNCAEFPPSIVTRYTVTGVLLKSRQRRTVPISKQIQVNGKDVILWRLHDQVFATSPICPHLAGNLSLGDLEDLGEIKGVCVTCPLHCWQFNVKTGECTNHKDNATLTTYPTFIDQDGRVYVQFDSFDSSLFSSQDF